MSYFLDPTNCFLYGSFLCLAFLELTGVLPHEFSLCDEPGLVVLGSLAHKDPSLVGQHCRTITAVLHSSLSWPVILMLLVFFTAYWFKAWPVPFLVDRMSIKGCTFFVCPISVLCSVRLLLCVFCTGFISTPRCILGRTARLCLCVRLRMVLVQFRGAQLYFTSKNMFLNDPLGSLATFFVVFHQLF